MGKNRIGKKFSFSRSCWSAVSVVGDGSRLSSAAPVYDRDAC
jgi:hypothetical protein